MIATPILIARLGLFAAIVAGGGTCEDDASAAAPPCGEEGCPTDLRCVADACVGETGPVYPITLRVLPTDAALGPVELANLRFADSPLLALPDAIALNAVVPVSGQVLGPDDRSQPVRRLVVEPIGGVAAQSLTVEGTFSPINPTLFAFSLTPFWPTIADPADRALVLDPQAVKYRVRAALRDLPPWEDDLVWDPTDRQVVVRVESTEDMPGIQGEVRLNDLPLRDIRVVALDPATGRQISNDSYTDETGTFAVRLWPTRAAQPVELAFDSADPARPLFTHRVPVTTPANGFAAPIRVDLPDSGPSVRTTVRVGQVQGDTRVALASVDVQLRRSIATGEHRVRGRTNANGEFSALVFPGDYVIDLAPSVVTALRLSRLKQPLGAQVTELTARPRTAISGAVVDADARPVADARIEATLLEAHYADETLARPNEAIPHRNFETQTDAAGRFLLTLDPGRHRLLINPPAASGLPPFIKLLDFQGEQPRTEVAIALPPAAVVSGTLVDSDGAAVTSAFVEVWVEGEPPFRLARHRTTVTGGFDLRIPVRLQTP